MMCQYTVGETQTRETEIVALKVAPGEALLALNFARCGERLVNCAITTIHQPK